MFVLNPTDMIQRMTLIDSLINIQTRIAGADVARKTEEETTPLTPLRRGWLERGFRSRMISTAPVMWEMLYSALSKKGYDYSARQHEEVFNHPIRGTDHYLLKGFQKTRPVELWESHLLRVL